MQPMRTRLNNSYEYTAVADLGRMNATASNPIFIYESKNVMPLACSGVHHGGGFGRQWGWWTNYILKEPRARSRDTLMQYSIETCVRVLIPGTMRGLTS